MGGSSSRPTGGLSRQDMLKVTHSSRDFMNLLFQQMITKLTPEDYLKLANPKECQQYVFTMADAISKLFDDLRIRPKREKDSGVVLFQKLDSLRTTSPEKKELCLIIAFFYVRIFQIFGALAMTVIDDPAAGQVLAAIRYAGVPATAGPARTRGVFLGGAGEIEPSYDEFRRRFPSFVHVYEELEFGEKKYGTYHYTFREIPQLDVFPALTKWNLQYKSTEGVVQALVQFVQKNTTTLDMSLSAFTLVGVEAENKTYERRMKEWFSKQRKITFTAKKIGESWVFEESTGSYTIPEKLRTRFDRMLTASLKFAQDPTGAAAIPGLVGGPRAHAPLGDRALHGAAEAKHHQVVDTFVPKMLQSGYIINTLKGLAGQKITAFCVARALQLIDANSLFSLQKGKPITSAVCQAKFDPLPSSVPVSGIQLDRIPAFKATEQLYFTQPSQGPTGETLLKVAPQDLTTYAEFLTTFATLFGKPVGAGALKGLDQIMARDPNCAATAAKHYLQITDPKRVQSIMAFVGQLFRRQVDHTKRVLGFVRNRLLLVQKRKNPVTGSVGDFIDIHPKLLAGGVDELARVSAEARGLLVGYFKDCEDIYQKGMAAVLASGPSVV